MPRRTPTRDLFVRACEAISVSRSLGDFKYAPSLNHMTRRRSEWTDLIYFQSSHYNVQDLSVKLRVGVNVRDEVLKRWRVRTNASARQDGAVAAAYLGYLGEPSVYLDWDIAGDDFAPAVTEICQRLGRDALAFFGLFTNLPRLNDLAIHVWLRHVLEPANTIELFLAHDLRQEIPRYIDLLQSSRAPVLDAARQRLLDPESITGVEARSRGGSGLAAVLRAHGLTDLLIEGAN